MNQLQSVVIASRGCHTVKRVGGVAHIVQQDQSLLFPPVQQRERHELCSKKGRGGFHYGTHQTHAAQLSMVFARRLNRGALFLQTRIWSLCNDRSCSPGVSACVCEGVVFKNNHTQTLEQGCTSVLNRHRTQKKIKRQKLKGKLSDTSTDSQTGLTGHRPPRAHASVTLKVNIGRISTWINTRVWASHWLQKSTTSAEGCQTGREIYF